MTGNRRALDETTRPIVDEAATPRVSSLLLTICHHPDQRRVGERYRLGPSDGARPLEISRLGPEFLATDGRSGGPLADPYISRTPLVALEDGQGGVSLRRPRDSPPLLVDGRPIGPTETLTAEQLARGVTLELARRVVLLLSRETGEPSDAPSYGLVGESEALRRVRGHIMRLSRLALPTLLRGESGTGKARVARAIHASSPRAHMPYVTLHLGALDPRTAAVRLFGRSHRPSEREACFRAADGGTLFLDGIGEATPEVQLALLRTLQTGEIQPVGGGEPCRVDVRVIAATDTNLEASVQRGSFRPALFHLLAGYEIRLPPLRHRRDDIARLLHHFLLQELKAGTLPDLDLARILTASVVGKLVRYDWPGNLHELRNAARQLLALSLSGSPCTPADAVGSLAHALADGGVSPALAGPRAPGGAAPARGARISDDALIASLQGNRWAIDATARELGISKNSLYALIARCPDLTRARDLPPERIVAVHERCDGDLERMSNELRVSVRGLKLRIRELGLRLAPTRPGAARPLLTRTP